MPNIGWIYKSIYDANVEMPKYIIAPTLARYINLYIDANVETLNILLPQHWPNI